MRKLFSVVLSLLLITNQLSFLSADDFIITNNISAGRLQSTNSPSDGQVPTYDSSSGGFTWDEGGGGGGDVTNIETTTTTKYLPTILDTQTLSATTTTVNFSSISQAYTDLEIKILARSTRGSSDNDTIKMSFNSDTTDANYLFGEFLGDGSNASGFAQDADGRELSDTPATSSPANDYGYIIIEIPEYTNTSINKMAIARAGVRFSATQQREAVQTLTWENTAAITDIDFDLVNANYASGSIFILVGYKNETIVTDVTGSGFVQASDFIDGGNTATGPMFLGSNNMHSLNLETNGITRHSIAPNGSHTFTGGGLMQGGWNYSFGSVTISGTNSFLMGTGTQINAQVSYNPDGTDFRIEEQSSSKPVRFVMNFYDTMEFNSDEIRMQSWNNAEIAGSGPTSGINLDSIVTLTTTHTGADYFGVQAMINLEGTGTLEAGSIVGNHIGLLPGLNTSYNGYLENITLVGGVILDQANTGTIGDVIAYDARWFPLGGSHTIDGDWTYYKADGNQILTTVGGNKLGLDIQNVDANVLDGKKLHLWLDQFIYQKFETSTTNATAQVLYAHPIPNNSVTDFEIRAIGSKDDGTDGMGIAIFKSYINKSGTVTEMTSGGGNTRLVRRDSAGTTYNCYLAINGTDVEVTVQGTASHNVDWDVVVKTLEL